MDGQNPNEIMEALKNVNELEALMKKCKESPGYVMFIGVYAKEGKPGEEREVEFSYKRVKYSFDDMLMAIKNFREHFHRDVEST